MYTKTSTLELQERRTVVERLLLRGAKPCEIIKKLKASNFHSDQFNDFNGVIENDIKEVRKGWKNLMSESSVALREYLARQLDLRAIAMAEKDLRLVRTINIDIARVLGVDVDKGQAIVNLITQHTEINYTELLNFVPEGSDKTMGELWRDVFRKEQIEDKSELVRNS